MRIKKVIYGILLSILLFSSVSAFRNNSVLAAQKGDDFLNLIIVPEVPTYNWTQTSLVSIISLYVENWLMERGLNPSAFAHIGFIGE